MFQSTRLSHSEQNREYTFLDQLDEKFGVCPDFVPIIYNFPWVKYSCRLCCLPLERDLYLTHKNNRENAPDRNFLAFNKKYLVEIGAVLVNGLIVVASLMRDSMFMHVAKKIYLNNSKKSIQVFEKWYLGSFH